MSLEGFVCHNLKPLNSLWSAVISWFQRLEPDLSVWYFLKVGYTHWQNGVRAQLDKTKKLRRSIPGTKAVALGRCSSNQSMVGLYWLCVWVALGSPVNSCVFPTTCKTCFSELPLAYFQTWAVKSVYRNVPRTSCKSLRSIFKCQIVRVLGSSTPLLLSSLLYVVLVMSCSAFQ